jgi:hypothetical protein
MLTLTIELAGNWMSTDRNANGRFAPGWRGGPGRPRRSVEAGDLAALSEAVPLATWEKIYETAVAQAVSVDAKAREWISGYLIGKPLAAVEVSAPDRSPLFMGVIVPEIMSVLDRYPGAREKMSAALERLQLELADRLGSAPRPGDGPPTLSA